MEVNKENMRLFIEALRSGKYQQGTGTLIEVGGDGVKRHCCLGVACEVAIANGVVLQSELVSSAPESFTRYHWDGGKTASYLPAPVVQWLGIDEREGPDTPVNPKLLHEKGNLIGATTLNDSYSLTFSQIADAFEKTYLPEDAENAGK
jgi:hypothetical protein